MQEPVLFNLQKFSIHDGDGIRTTVFFKGCPLRCLWCHNPESQSPKKELMFYAERCTGCGMCTKVCPKGAANHIAPDRSICDAGGKCARFCLYGAREVVGYTMDVDTLVQEIVKDTPFYEVSGGGVTLSGGEPLLADPEYLEALCKRLSRRGYRINIDTCGYVPYERMARLLPYVDTFLYDLKAMDSEKHLRLTGVSNDLILENLQKLSDAGAKINIRLPLIAGLNDTPADIDALLTFLSHIHVDAVNLLPYHRTGSDKYARIGKDATTGLEAPSAEHLEDIRLQFVNTGIISVKIGG